MKKRAILFRLRCRRCFDSSVPLWGFKKNDMLFANPRRRFPITSPDSKPKESVEQIQQRIKHLLESRSAASLKAWLKTVDLPSSTSHPVILELVANSIASGQLVEGALEHALIGFEEASEKRVYLYNLESCASRSDGWLQKHLGTNVPTVRKFSGDSVKPMTPVYALLSDTEMRVKWTEEHTYARYVEEVKDTVRTAVRKNIVLIADFSAKTAELRLDPPENVQPHDQLPSQTSADAYYAAYIAKAAEMMDCIMTSVAFDKVIPNLVKEEDPRVVRIHIDNHTNQTNLGLRATSLRSDVRDQEEWRRLYDEYGHTWTWEYQKLYWLPKPSAGQLKRELYSHLNAEVGYLKLSADCSDDEVTYAVSRIREREGRASSAR